jgi:hypothetical protein
MAEELDPRQGVGRLTLVESGLTAPGEPVQPEEASSESLPPNVQSVYLGGLFLLALLVVSYAAAEILLPIVVAFVLMLVLQPPMRLLSRLHVPRALAALLLILVFFSILVGLGTALSGPAARWAEKLPEGIPKLQERLSFLSRPIASLQKFVSHAEKLTQGAGVPTPLPVAVAGYRTVSTAARGNALYRERYARDGTRSVFPAALGRHIFAPFG